MDVVDQQHRGIAVSGAECGAGVVTHSGCEFSEELIGGCEHDLDIAGCGSLAGYCVEEMGLAAAGGSGDVERRVRREGSASHVDRRVVGEAVEFARQEARKLKRGLSGVDNLGRRVGCSSAGSKAGRARLRGRFKAHLETGPGNSRQGLSDDRAHAGRKPIAGSSFGATTTSVVSSKRRPAVLRSQVVVGW